MDTAHSPRSTKHSGRSKKFLHRLGHGINMARLVIINMVFFALLGLVLLLILKLYASLHGHLKIFRDSLLELKPQGQLVEQYSIRPLQRSLARLNDDAPKQVRLSDLLRVINTAAKDPRIKGIMLDPGGLHSAGFAALHELGEALDSFRNHGKPVIAWSHDLDQKQYYLAVHADEVLLDPKGELILTGLASYRLFYKDLLDRLGVQVHLFRAGQFKSAAEPYVFDHASSAAKKAERFWMEGLWTEYLREVAKRRQMNPATLRAAIDHLPARITSTQGSLARLALNEHLIDALVTPAELTKKLYREGVTNDPENSGIHRINMTDYLATLPQTNRTLTPGVTVIVVEGDIKPGKHPPGAIGGQNTAALIRSARKDKHTRALVLRVNSPGGAISPSEQIRREVALTRAAGIPVVVSMGDMAASGGYWISMNANRILAEPNTITGSIGVFGLYVSLPGTLAKLGIVSDGVATGPMAGVFDARRPLAPGVSTLIQAIVDKNYHDFVAAIAKARGKSFATINKIAQGRVWSGRQAWQRGLVDQLGGLGQAITEAARLGRLDAPYPVRYRQPPVSIFEHLLLDLSYNVVAQMAWHWIGIMPPQSLMQVSSTISPVLDWLRHAQPGKPNVYAYCFCTLE